MLTPYPPRNSLLSGSFGASSWKCPPLMRSYLLCKKETGARSSWWINWSYPQEKRWSSSVSGLLKYCLRLKTKSQLQKSKRLRQSSEVNHGYPGFRSGFISTQFGRYNSQSFVPLLMTHLLLRIRTKHFISCWVVGSFYPSTTVIG